MLILSNTGNIILFRVNWCFIGCLPNAANLIFRLTNRQFSASKPIDMLVGVDLVGWSMGVEEIKAIAGQPS